MLVTPQGVWKANIVGGVPGAWLPKRIDVIVHGFGNGTPLPPGVPPDAPPSDPIVLQVAAVSKSLKNQQEATSVAVLINALVKAGIQQKDFAEALDLSAKITDSALKADGRVIAWAKSATTITSDPMKLLVGLMLAWDIKSSTIDEINAAAQLPAGAVVTGEAINFMKLIETIKFLIELFKSLGFI